MTRYVVTGRIDVRYNGRLYRAGDVIEPAGGEGGLALKPLIESGSIEPLQTKSAEPERKGGGPRGSHHLVKPDADPGRGEG